MDRKDVINFAPSGIKKRRSVPRYVGVIIALCLAVFCISVFVILARNDFDIGKALGAREPETTRASEMTTEAEGSTEDVTEADSALFLVMCSDKNELTFCQIIKAEPSARKITVKPVDPELSIEFSSEKMSVAEAFRTMSYAAVAEGFSSIGMEIDRYVHITEDNFKRLMSKLGPVPVEVEGNYEINIDAVRYTFSPGIQNMTSDILLKYMKLAEKGDAAMRLQGRATASVFRQHFTEENYLKGEDFFSALINLVDTDITVFDYGKADAVLSSMLSGEVTVSAVG